MDAAGTSPVASRFRMRRLRPGRTSDICTAVNPLRRRQHISVSGMTFGALGVPSSLVASLEKRGITEPFPIQTATLPDTLRGRDVLGRGRTGSGKTLAFSLPLVARLADGGRARSRPPAVASPPRAARAAGAAGSPAARTGGAAPARAAPGRVAVATAGAVAAAAPAAAAPRCGRPRPGRAP